MILHEAFIRWALPKAILSGPGSHSRPQRLHGEAEDLELLLIHIECHGEVIVRYGVKTDYLKALCETVEIRKSETIETWSYHGKSP